MDYPQLPVRKYLKTAEMAATAHFGDSSVFLFDYVLRVLRVVILLALWRTVLAGRGDVSGMTLGAILTYTLIAEVFAQQLDVHTRIEDALWEGTLAGRFLQPLGLVGQITADAMGTWAFGFATFSLPLLLLAPLLGVSALPDTPAAGGLFLASLALAVSIGLALDFCFAALVAAARQNIWQVVHLRNALTTILSGALLPLQLYPWGLGDVLGWLPFASMASAPLRIYTGTGDAPSLLLLQGAWSVILWPLANWLWNRHRERLAFHGG